MSSLNKVQLIGHLGADPEVRHTTGGNPVVTMRIATSEQWRDKVTGDRKERTAWHTVVIFNEGLAKVAEQYLKKGSKAYVEGQLATRKWQAADGTDRYSTEVILRAYGGSLILLDRAERAVPNEDAYGAAEASRVAQGQPLQHTSALPPISMTTYRSEGRAMIPHTDLSIQRVSHRLGTPRRLAEMLITLANDEIVPAAVLADRFGEAASRQTIRRLRENGWFVGSRQAVGYFLRTGDRELVHEAALINEQAIVIRRASPTTHNRDSNGRHL